MSTVFSSIRFSILRLTTFWRMSVFCFSVRAKYASRSPAGDHDIHGTALLRNPPGVTMYSNPRSLLNPLVRLRITLPSLVDISTMSSSWSLRLPAATAMRSSGGGRLDRNDRDVGRPVALRREVPGRILRTLLVAERLKRPHYCTCVIL